MTSRALLLLASLAAAGGFTPASVTTTFKRLPGNVIEFGGSVLVQEPCPADVDKSELAAFLSDPRTVLETAWDARRIDTLRESAFRLRLQTINLLAVAVDANVDVVMDCGSVTATTTTSTTLLLLPRCCYCCYCPSHHTTNSLTHLLSAGETVPSR